MNKKAQGLSVTTIILIVLGLIVLVLLILGFTLGWSNLRDFVIKPNNVDTIVQQCGIACNTDQKFAYCTESRELKTKEERLRDVTCFSLAEKKSVYGISKCALIDCEIFSDETAAKANCKGKTVTDKVQHLGTDEEALVVKDYDCTATDI